MDRYEIITELTAIIGDYLKNQGVDLVDLIYRYEGKNLFLRILVDNSRGGIALDDCVYLNKQISAMLDEKDIIKHRYILEISSPGLDRPLKNKDDFLRSLKKKVRFFFSEPVNGKMELEGMVGEVTDDSVWVDIGGDALKIPLVKINRAKQVIGEKI